MNWINFQDQMPKTAKRLLIKLKDGRELKGVRFHNELWFEEVASGLINSTHWDLDLQSEYWSYIK